MSETLYSARWFGPTLIEQGKDQTFSVSIERSGAAVTISSGTTTVYKPGGEKLIDEVAGTISSGTYTTATIAAAITSAATLGPRYLVQVDLVISGDTYTFYNDAVLCAARLYPPIGQTDLIERHSEAANLLGAAVSSLQQYIDQAWRDITVRLYTDGVPFWKWRTPSALRGVLMAHAFEILFWDYSTLLAGDDRYREYAQKYSEMYERDYTQLRSNIDESEDNSLKDEMATGSAVIMLSSSARRFKGSRRDR